MHSLTASIPLRHFRPLRLALVWLSVTAGLAACGYQMESPQLPNQRHSIGVAPVRNLTYEAELDVRMQEELRRRLYRDPSIRVAEPARSELVLTVEIQELNLTRARDLDSTDVRRLSLQLKGVMSLRDSGTGELVFDRRAVQARSRYDLPDSALETPALRDDAINTVLSAFADRVVEQLLLTF